MFELSQRYQKNPEMVARQIAGELILVPIRQNVADMDCIYTLNPVGAFIWDKLDGRATLADLQAAIVNEYDTDAQTAAADLAEFVQELEAAGAIRKV